MTNRIARLRIRVREKATHRTWVVDWPPDGGILFCGLTGSKHLVVTTLAMVSTTIAANRFSIAG